MVGRLLRHKEFVGIMIFILLIAFVGIFAPWFAPHDPYDTNIMNKYAAFSSTYPLGTDQLGRCILSRMIYGIRPTLGLATITMIGTIALGGFMGIISGYFGGIIDELIMRVVDVVLSFPSPFQIFNA